jgi:hypothetical protein
MTYYATYRFGNGKWQTTMILEGKMGSVETLDFHEEGLDYITAKTRKDLERKKEKIDRQKKE